MNSTTPIYNSTIFGNGFGGEEDLVDNNAEEQHKDLQDNADDLETAGSSHSNKYHPKLTGFKRNGFRRGM
jgi:hypothetical protein